MGLRSGEQASQGRARPGAEEADSTRGLPGAPCAPPYHASSMKPMTNLRTSIDLSTWKAMISCQCQEEGGSGLHQDPSPHPSTHTFWLPSVTHIQEVVQ